MAGCYLPVTFLSLCRDSFYFEGVNTDLEGDAFTASSHLSKHLSYSLEHKFLFLNYEGQFEINNLTKVELCGPESIFNICIYKSSQRTMKGRPVMLYANKNGTKVVVCCSNNREIVPKEMDPPNRIDENQHEALFYLTELGASDMYMLESTVHQSRFLAFERDSNNFLRLVLREKKDQVDVNCQITVSQLE